MAKILVVDDSATIREMTKTVLEEAGYEVLLAEEGLSGLEMARTKCPDLIILDVMLPNLDGYQICRMLKFDESYAKIPIVMFTARSADSDKKLGAEVKANDYITKDFQPQQLLAVVKKYVKSPAD